MSAVGTKIAKPANNLAVTMTNGLGSQHSTARKYAVTTSMINVKNGFLAATFLAGLLGSGNEAAAYIMNPSISGTSGSGTVAFEFTYFRGPFAEFSGSSSSITSSGLLNGAPIKPSGTPGVAYANTGNTYGFLTGATTIPGGPASVSLSYAGGSVPTVISFQPFDFTNQLVYSSFSIGRFTFTNGQWYGAGQTSSLNAPTVLGFTIRTTGTGGAASLFTQTINGELTLTVNNPQPADYTTLAGQQAEADWISLSSSAKLRPFPAFRVYDSYAMPPGATNTGTVDLVAAFGSLYLETFDNPTGGAFLTAGNGPLQVPEPVSLSLLGVGLAGLCLVRRRPR